MRPGLVPRAQVDVPVCSEPYRPRSRALGTTVRLAIDTSRGSMAPDEHSLSPSVRHQPERPDRRSNAGPRRFRLAAVRDNQGGEEHSPRLPDVVRVGGDRLDQASIVSRPKEQSTVT